MDDKINAGISTKRSGMSVTSAVVLATVISLSVATFNLFIFIRSDMYEKVRLIQNPVQQLSDGSTLDLSSPINSEQVLFIKQEINNRFDILKDDKDYSEYDISDSTLGL